MASRPALARVRLGQWTRYVRRRIAACAGAFAHLQSAYAARNEAMSLGLAIAKRLVELQGGSFAITSILGEGTQTEISFSAAALTGKDGKPGGDAA